MSIKEPDAMDPEGEFGPPVAFHFAYCTEAIGNAKGMDSAAFMVAIKRRGSNIDRSADPLAKVTELLAQISPTAEGQALKRVLRALATKDGTFRESDVYLFGATALALIAALIDARMAGRYRQEEWDSLTTPSAL